MNRGGLCGPFGGHTRWGPYKSPVAPTPLTVGSPSLEVPGWPRPPPNPPMLQRRVVRFGVRVNGIPQSHRGAASVLPYLLGDAFRETLRTAPCFVPHRFTPQPSHGAGKELTPKANGKLRTTPQRIQEKASAAPAPTPAPWVGWSSPTPATRVGDEHHHGHGRDPQPVATRPHVGRWGGGAVGRWQTPSPAVCVPCASRAPRSFCGCAALGSAGAEQERFCPPLPPLLLLLWYFLFLLLFFMVCFLFLFFSFLFWWWVFLLFFFGFPNKFHTSICRRRWRHSVSRAGEPMGTRRCVGTARGPQCCWVATGGPQCHGVAPGGSQCLGVATRGH